MRRSSIAPDSRCGRSGPNRPITSRRSKRSRAVAAEVAARAFQARFFAGISLIELKRYDEALGALKALLEPPPPGPSADCRGAEQSRRARAPPRRDAADRHRRPTT